MFLVGQLIWTATFYFKNSKCSQQFIRSARSNLLHMFIIAVLFTSLYSQTVNAQRTHDTYLVPKAPHCLSSSTSLSVSICKPALAGLASADITDTICGFGCASSRVSFSGSSMMSFIILASAVTVHPTAMVSRAPPARDFVVLSSGAGRHFCSAAPLCHSFQATSAQNLQNKTLSTLMLPRR